MTALFPHTITILRAEAADRYGNSGGVAETAEDGWSVQPLLGEEIVADRDTVTTRKRATRDRASGLRSTDRVRFAGNVYEVDGDVQFWDFGDLSNTDCLLIRIEG